MEFTFLTSTRADGNMAIHLGEPAEAIANRKKLIDYHSLKVGLGNLVCMRVTHGSTVKIVDQTHSGIGALDNNGIEADALVSQTPGLMIGLLTADCVPIFLTDQDNGWFGLIHASRESADLGVIENTLELLKENQVDVARLKVVFGPYIHQVSYKLNHVPQASNSAWSNFIVSNKDKSFNIDLGGYCRSIFIHAGVRDLQTDNADTFQDDFYFSHKRSQEFGEPEARMISLIYSRNLR